MADTEYFGRTQVGTISSPALSQSEVGGTSHVLNSSGRSRPRRGRMGTPTALSALTGPLRRDSQAEILGSAGLGRRAPEKKSQGEQMSDADQPTQAVEAQPDGSMMHHRANTDGSVTSSPIGNPDFSYGSMPRNLDELQQNMNVPDFFGVPV
jgi:hypothetical protein